MGAKVHVENYFPVLFPNENAKPDTRINNSLPEAWPRCARDIILKENIFYSNTKQGAMGLCSEKDMEILKLTMLKHEHIFKEQVRELHRLYHMQKQLMTDLRIKDSNTSTLTSGTVQEGSFANHTGSELLKLDGKGNFWAALNGPNANRDSRDQQQPISGVDYMQNYRSGLFEKNQQMGLSPQEFKQNPRDFYNLQPSRATRLIFDLEQSADVYMDAEVTNQNEEENTKRRAFKNGVEPESDLQLTLKTGCEKAAKENGKQTGPYIQFDMSQLRREEVEEDKQLRCQEEAIFFPAVSTRSVTRVQEEWQSDSTDSRAKQRESRYAWPKEGILSGAVPQQRNSLFAMVSSKGFLIDPSSTPRTGTIHGVSPGLSLNSHREMQSSGLWRKTEEGLCQIPHELHSQDFCILPAELELQKQNFCPQDKYHAQPFVTSGTNRMNVKRQASEYGMGNWYQNGNLVQHTQQDSPSIYHAGSPLIFGQALCQTGPVVGSLSNQQQGAHHAMPASTPSSSGFPSGSLQECSRSLWSTSSISFSTPQALDDKSCLDRKIGKIDLTLGLSSMGIEEARKNASCYSSATNIMEDAHTYSSCQVDATNEKLHRESMQMHGIDVQSSENFTRTFIELPSIQETKSDSVKHIAHLNGLDFSDLLKPLSESMQYIRAGDGIGLTKHLMDDLGDRGAQQSKDNIAFASELWKVHDFTKEGVNSEAPQAEGGILKPDNLLGLVDKPMNNSTPIHGIIGKSPELKADSHIDRHIHLHGVADSGEHEMQIRTFKENINAVYGPVEEERFTVRGKFLSPVGDHVNTDMHEETTLVLGIRGKINPNKVSRQMEMEARDYTTSDKEKVRAGSGSQASFAMRDPIPTDGVVNNGGMVDNFTYQVLVSDISPVVNVTRQGSIETENAFNFDQEERKGSEEAVCHSGFKKAKVSKDGTEKDAHAQQTDSTEPSSETPKDHMQPSQYQADLEQCTQYVHMQRGCKFNIEPEVDTLQTKAMEGPSCSSPFLESAEVVNSAPRNSSVDTNVAANVLLKIKSKGILDWSDIDSCESLFASGMKASLDWFADAVVSNANCVETTISGHREDTDHPLSSPRSGSNTKEPEVSEDSTPKENACSPNASNGLDFFESMTLMLEETIVDTDCKPLAKQEEEAEKTPSAINSISMPYKRRKRKRDRDFQKEILPSISSLSRQEVTEDMQIIGGLMRSAGDAWHTGSTRRTSGKFSLRDDWFVPLTGRRSRHISGFRANVGTITRNIDVQASRRHDQEVERVNALSWTSSWGETIRRRRMQRHRAPMTSLALNPV